MIFWAIFADFHKIVRILTNFVIFCGNLIVFLGLLLVCITFVLVFLLFFCDIVIFFILDGRTIMVVSVF